MRTKSFCRSLLLPLLSVFTLAAFAAVADAPKLEKISLSPSSATIATGRSQQFTVIGHFDDDSTQDLTALAKYSSSKSKTAVVDAKGLATGMSEGEVKIKASYHGKDDDSTLRVVGEPKLQRISIVPSSATIAIGGTQQFTVTGTFTDGSTVDLTEVALYSSSEQDVALAGIDGSVVGVDDGDTDIEAEFMGKHDEAELTVTGNPKLEKVTLTPTETTIAVGEMQVFTLTAHYKDGHNEDVTDRARYESDDQKVAVVSPTGVGFGVAPGDTEIEGFFHGKKGKATLNVVGPRPPNDHTVDFLVISPRTAAILTGSNQAFRVLAIFKNGSTQDVTTVASYRSDDQEVALVGITGIATGISEGDTEIKASFMGKSVKADLTVLGLPELVSISISPSEAILFARRTMQFKVTALFDDGSSKDITGAAFYSSSRQEVVLAGTNGVAIGVSVGTARIKAEYLGEEDESTITVPVGVFIQGLVLNEGDTGTTNAVVSVTLYPPTDKQVTVRYATADGTATLADGDYLPTSGLLVFAPGQTNKTITVQINGDRLSEPDETLFIVLTNATNAVVASLQALVTIRNDDLSAVPAVSIDNATVIEGNTGTINAILTVRLSTPAVLPVTVAYETADGTATLTDGDYLPASGTLTFAPGESNKTIAVQVIGDWRNETDETVLLSLSAATNASIAVPLALLTIQNDDPLPSLTIDSVTVDEGASGTTAALLTVRLSSASGQTVTVDYATTNGTATTANSDYSPASGRLIFLPDETNKLVTVAIIGDQVFEPDETVLVQLSNPTNATITTSTGILTIRNDDPQGLALAINSLPNLVTINSNRLTIVGSFDPPNGFIQVNGVTALLSNGTFSADVLLHEGNNTLQVVGTDSHGQVTTTSLQVTVDTTAPRVTIDSPKDGAILSDPFATVTGVINDTVVGTVNGEQASVQVNGLAASVANRTYAVMNVPLVPGTNTIAAIGTDQVGNRGTNSIKVFYNTNVAPRIVAVSGDGQVASIGVLLPQPLVVLALDTNGQPCANKKIIFKVAQNDGLVTGPTNTARSLIVTSGPDGLAGVQFRLGTRAGVGNNQVSAAIVGFEGEAMFCASATPSTPGLLALDAGNNQIGIVGQSLPRAFATIVVDAGHNRLPNVPITFTVTEGGGTFGGQTNVTVNSDSDGRALAVLTLGPGVGNDNNRVTANFSGNTGSPAFFVASARAPGDPAETSISGVVLDNSDVPVPGALMRIVGQPNAVLSDSNGFFRIKPAPVGNVRLIADGSTVTRPGTWVWLQFDLVTIAGQDNGIGMPVRLLPIDIAHGLLVDPTHGGTLTLTQAPGYSLKVASNSVTFPDGSHSGVVSVTIVHPDKMPDPPSFGQQPRFLVSIQPANSVFNPPAPMCIPNLDGLPPGQKTDMYSYDHDMGRFVSIGTGTVSEDGTMLCSDPGNGVIKGGWHCGGNPSQSGSGQSATVSILGPNTGCLNSTLNFSAAGSPSPGTYIWSGGENPATAQGASFQTQFRNPGRKTVTVIYTCANGSTASASQAVSITCPTEIVSAGGTFCGSRYGANFTYSYSCLGSGMWAKETVTWTGSGCSGGNITQTTTPIQLAGSSLNDEITNGNGPPASVADCTDTTAQTVYIGPTQATVTTCSWSHTQTITVSRVPNSNPPTGTVKTCVNGLCTTCTW